MSKKRAKEIAKISTPQAYFTCKDFPEYTIVEKGYGPFAN